MAAGLQSAWADVQEVRQLGTGSRKSGTALGGRAWRSRRRATRGRVAGQRRGDARFYACGLR
ncbi:hypothetical protein [Streptomyces canus]|uniref:hypothetical protein n=1 Tax=Streptomyces canus TaxID=58343 RepID=UPI0033B062FE